MSKINRKHYSCKNCGYDKEIETNHYGECYSLPGYNECPDCKHPTTWVCQEKSPEGVDVPEHWKWTTVEDLCHVSKSSKSKGS